MHQILSDPFKWESSTGTCTYPEIKYPFIHIDIYVKGQLGILTINI